jgi:hypothetical protein
MDLSCSVPSDKEWKLTRQGPEASEQHGSRTRIPGRMDRGVCLSLEQPKPCGLQGGAVCCLSFAVRVLVAMHAYPAYLLDHRPCGEVEPQGVVMSHSAVGK